jgi:ribulose-phosphate 3-epimerase
MEPKISPSKISPSMMCADIGRLESVLREFEAAGIEYLHIDVMDGAFVPSFTLGTDYVRQLKKMTDIPLDVHLMIEKPENKIGWFDIGPGDYVSVHCESTPHIHRAVERIRAAGAKPMLAVNPGTPIGMAESLLGEIDAVLVMTVDPGFAGQKMAGGSIKKIQAVKKWLTENGYEHIEIEVDGNVSFENAVLMRKAGADIFVAGTSSIFTSEMPMRDAMEKLRNVLKC